MLSSEVEPKRTLYDESYFLPLTQVTTVTDDRATGRHLPYGITQCYLPPDTSERDPP